MNRLKIAWLVLTGKGCVVDSMNMIITGEMKCTFVVFKNTNIKCENPDGTTVEFC